MDNIVPKMNNTAIKKQILEFKNVVQCEYLKQNQSTSINTTVDDINRLKDSLCEFEDIEIKNNDQKNIFIDSLIAYLSVVTAYVESKYKEPRQKILMLNNYMLQPVQNVLSGRVLSNAFVEQGTEKIFEMFWYDKLDFWCKQYILKVYNTLCELSDKSLRHKCAKNQLSILYMLIDALDRFSDYDTQTSILEWIFRVYGAYIKENTDINLIPNNKTLNLCLINDINAKTFDMDIRQFLNRYNAKANAVFSIGCKYLTCVGKVCLVPEVMTMHWVDFNSGSQCISWYCDKSQLFDQVSEDYQGIMEYISIFYKGVRSVEMRRIRGEVGIIILSKEPCLSSTDTQEIFNKETTRLEMVLSDDYKEDVLAVSNVLRKIFKKKFKDGMKLGVTEPQPLNIRISRRISSASNSNNNSFVGQPTSPVQRAVVDYKTVSEKISKDVRNVCCNSSTVALTDFNRSFSAEHNIESRSPNTNSVVSEKGDMAAQIHHHVAEIHDPDTIGTRTSTFNYQSLDFGSCKSAIFSQTPYQLKNQEVSSNVGSSHLSNSLDEDINRIQILSGRTSNGCPLVESQHSQNSQESRLTCSTPVKKSTAIHSSDEYETALEYLGQEPWSKDPKTVPMESGGSSQVDNRNSAKALKEALVDKSKSKFEESTSNALGNQIEKSNQKRSELNFTETEKTQASEKLEVQELNSKEEQNEHVINISRRVNSVPNHSKTQVGESAELKQCSLIQNIKTPKKRKSAKENEVITSKRHESQIGVSQLNQMPDECVTNEANIPENKNTEKLQMKEDLTPLATGELNRTQPHTLDEENENLIQKSIMNDLNGSKLSRKKTEDDIPVREILEHEIEERNSIERLNGTEENMHPKDQGTTINHKSKIDQQNGSKTTILEETGQIGIISSHKNVKERRKLSSGSDQENIDPNKQAVQKSPSPVHSNSDELFELPVIPEFQIIKRRTSKKTAQCAVSHQKTIEHLRSRPPKPVIQGDECEMSTIYEASNENTASKSQIKEQNSNESKCDKTECVKEFKGFNAIEAQASNECVEVQKEANESLDDGIIIKRTPKPIPQTQLSEQDEQIVPDTNTKNNQILDTTASTSTGASADKRRSVQPKRKARKRIKVDESRSNQTLDVLDDNLSTVKDRLESNDSTSGNLKLLQQEPNKVASEAKEPAVFSQSLCESSILQVKTPRMLLDSQSSSAEPLNSEQNFDHIEICTQHGSENENSGRQIIRSQFGGSKDDKEHESLDLVKDIMDVYDQETQEVARTRSETSVQIQLSGDKDHVPLGLLKDNMDIYDLTTQEAPSESKKSEADRMIYEKCRSEIESVSDDYGVYLCGPPPNLDVSPEQILQLENDEKSHRTTLTQEEIHTAFEQLKNNEDSELITTVRVEPPSTPRVKLKDPRIEKRSKRMILKTERPELLPELEPDNTNNVFDSIKNVTYEHNNKSIDARNNDALSTKSFASSKSKKRLYTPGDLSHLDEILESIDETGSHINKTGITVIPQVATKKGTENVIEKHKPIKTIIKNVTGTSDSDISEQDQRNVVKRREKRREVNINVFEELKVIRRELDMFLKKNSPQGVKRKSPGELKYEPLKGLKLQRQRQSSNRVQRGSYSSGDADEIRPVKAKKRKTKLVANEESVKENRTIIRHSKRLSVKAKEKINIISNIVVKPAEQINKENIDKNANPSLRRVGSFMNYSEDEMNSWLNTGNVFSSSKI